MSYIVQAWLNTKRAQRRKEGEVLGLGPLWLLESMGDQAHDDGTLWAKNQTYVDRSGATERSIQRWTKTLEQLGYIRKISQYAEDGSGRQINNGYQILMPEASQLPSPPRGGRVTAVSPSPLTPVSPSGVTAVSPPNKPSIETITEHPPTPSGEGESRLIHGPILSSEERAAPTATLEAAAAARTRASEGIQALGERLWREQGRHIDRKLSRAIKGRLRVGETVEALWADYFALEPSAPAWNPPQSRRDAYELCWAPILRSLGKSQSISPHTHTTWLTPLRVVGVAQEADGRSTLTLAAPTREFSLWVEANLGDEIRAEAESNDVVIEFWRPEGEGAPA